MSKCITRELEKRQNNNIELVFEIREQAKKYGWEFESTQLKTVDMEEREKQQREPPSSPGDNTTSIIDFPLFISASNDASAQKEMLLKTKGSPSPSRLLRTKSDCNTTTQKMFLASSENGIVVTPNAMWTPGSKKVQGSPARQPQSSLADAGDASTLPTFISVGSSLDWPKDAGSHTSFMVPKENGDKSPSHVVTLTSDAVQDRESRKLAHYRGKLRLLTDRHTSSPAAADKSRSRGRVPATSAYALEKNADDETETADCGRNILDHLRKKLFACSMAMYCVDEGVVDHEGKTIVVPTSSSTEHGASSSVSDDDISTLTEPTHHRFQTRYKYSSRHYHRRNHSGLPAV